MINTYRIRVVCTVLLFLLSLFFSAPVAASTVSYKITDGFTGYFPDFWVNGFGFFSKDIYFNYTSGNVILSANPDGTGDMHVADTLKVYHAGNTIFAFDAHHPLCLDKNLKPLPPVDISSFYEFGIGFNRVLVALYRWCGGNKSIGPMYLVNTNIRDPEPTPTSTPPTPTPIPGPVPFLDLPWDYEGKGLSFNEAAFSINSYFDHEYPLLGSGLGEPDYALGLIVNFKGFPRIKKDYSSHDGYDYGRGAKANNGDPVLAAAAGCASYSYSSAGGHTIKIDHGNYYQTRYLHLQDTGLITKETSSCMNVSKGQQIGIVGSTGNSTGAHIHFGVVEDKNKDGNFEDNVPDGATDPFGWQSKEQDPWPAFVFDYAGQRRTGNRSYYLWKKKLDSLDATLTSNGGVFNTGRFKVEFPKDATDKNLNLNIESFPLVKAFENIVSIGSSIVIAAKDSLGNLVTRFDKPFILFVDFSSFDLTRYNTDTLSIYSSGDGVTWTKESTVVDFVTKSASATLNHLTHFALMAERKDTIPPTTTARVEGLQGQPSWFRSDATVTLTAQDNEGGLGVDYTLYRIETQENTTDWTEYLSPLVFTKEGHHKIEFYSVDKDENVEEVESVEFDIDKTPPEVKLDANPKEIWPPNSKMVDITITGSAIDKHLYSKTISVEDEYDLIEPTISDFGQTIQLEAKREGSDKDGRRYIIKARAEDLAGNITEQQTQVIVSHDQGKKKK